MNNTTTNTTIIEPTTTTTRTTVLSTIVKVLKKSENLTNTSKISGKIRAVDFQQTILENYTRTNKIPECVEGLTELCQKEQLEWWAYVILAIFIFLILLLLNFIVKKINDARMEERCARLYRKSSTYSEVKMTLTKGDYSSKKKVDNTKSMTSTLTGVSLIFTKSDNNRFSTSTSTATGLRIADCGEAFRNRSRIDSICEESEFPHTIHRDTNTPTVVQNNDIVNIVKDVNDIEKTKLASGDANANTISAEITITHKESSNTTDDSDGNISNTMNDTKGRAYLEFKALRKRFEVLGKKTPIFLKKQFHTINNNTTINNDKHMVNSKKITIKNSYDDIVMTNEKHSIEKKMEINNIDPGEETKVTNIENKIILNGSKSRNSETKNNVIKDVKSKISLTEIKKGLEKTEEGNDFENNKCENA